MGCSNSAKGMNDEKVLSELLSSFVLNNLTKFRTLLKSISSNKGFDINKFTVSAFSNIQLTLPALSIVYGRLAFFQYINENFKLDMLELDTSLNGFNVSALFFLCSKNYAELFSYFLPIYSRHAGSFQSRSSYALSFADQTDSEALTTYTPIQIACECGHIAIVKAAFEYYQDKASVPMELNVNYVDPSTGENCALIACKQNNYALIRFLHKICKADFNVKNNHKENCLQLLCLGFKRYKETELIKACRYLVEDAEVDITYKYEETMLLCEDSSTYEYLEHKLLQIGIIVKKNESFKEKGTFGSV